MRVFALLLGSLLTAGSVAVTDVAVSSAHVARFRTADPAGAGAIWYGGTLPPIVVQAPRATAPARALARSVSPRAGDGLECAAAPHAGTHPLATTPPGLIR